MLQLEGLNDPAQPGASLDQEILFLQQGFPKVLRACSELEVVLLVGSTGSGKTTLLNYLLGHSMRQEQRGGQRVVVTEGESSFTIGHGTESETLFTEAAKDPQFNIAWCDTQGYNDTRDIDQSAVGQLLQRYLLERVRGLKAILVVISLDSLYNDRATVFRSAVTHLLRWLKPGFLATNSVFVVFTMQDRRWPERSQKDLNDKVSIRQEVIHKLKTICDAKTKTLQTMRQKNASYNTDRIESEMETAFLDQLIKNNSYLIFNNILDPSQAARSHLVDSVRQAPGIPQDRLNLLQDKSLQWVKDQINPCIVDLINFFMIKHQNEQKARWIQKDLAFRKTINQSLEQEKAVILRNKNQQAQHFFGKLLHGEKKIYFDEPSKAALTRAGQKQVQQYQQQIDTLPQEIDMLKKHLNQREHRFSQLGSPQEHSLFKASWHPKGWLNATLESAVYGIGGLVIGAFKTVTSPIGFPVVMLDPASSVGDKWMYSLFSVFITPVSMGEKRWHQLRYGGPDQVLYQGREEAFDARKITVSTRSQTVTQTAQGSEPWCDKALFHQYFTDESFDPQRQQYSARRIPSGKLGTLVTLELIQCERNNLYCKIKQSLKTYINQTKSLLKRVKVEFSHAKTGRLGLETSRLVNFNHEERLCITQGILDFEKNDLRRARLNQAEHQRRVEEHLKTYTRHSPFLYFLALLCASFHRSDMSIQKALRCYYAELTPEEIKILLKQFLGEYYSDDLVPLFLKHLEEPHHPEPGASDLEEKSDILENPGFPPRLSKNPHSLFPPNCLKYNPLHHKMLEEQIDEEGLCNQQYGLK